MYLGLFSLASRILKGLWVSKVLKSSKSTNNCSTQMNLEPSVRETWMMNVVMNLCIICHQFNVEVKINITITIFCDKWNVISINLSHPSLLFYAGIISCLKIKKTMTCFHSQIPFAASNVRNESRMEEVPWSTCLCYRDKISDKPLWKHKDCQISFLQPVTEEKIESLSWDKR